VAISLNNLGLVLLELGQLDEARTLFEESLATKQALDDRRGQAMTRINLGLLAGQLGRTDEAASQLARSLSLLAALDDQAPGAEALLQLAGVAASAGLADRAARILGAQDALREALGVPVSAADRPHYEAIVAQVQTALGEAPFAAGWSAGRALAWPDAVADALDAAARMGGS
jgi:tetratricopeptide (TPR) repeat protein